MTLWKTIKEDILLIGKRKGQIVDLASLAGAIISILRTIRDQLADVVNNLLPFIRWTIDKAQEVVRFTLEQFPYDNYSRAVMLGLIVMVLITSLLALFGVAKYSEPIFLGGSGFMPSNPNPNALDSSDQMTIGIGKDSLRDRIGVAGTGIAINEDEGATPAGGGGGTGGATTTTLQGGEIPENDTIYTTLCGNGICQDNLVTAAKTIITNLNTDDGILYYDIPVWCLQNDITLQYYNINNQLYQGILGTKNLLAELNQYCNISSYTREIIYNENTINCATDCLQQNRTNKPYPDFCYNLQRDIDDGEEEIDCGGLCMPCSCHNGIKDGNEIGEDCGGSCPPCDCNPTGINYDCALPYCCPEDTGLCANHCVDWSTSIYCVDICLPDLPCTDGCTQEDLKLACKRPVGDGTFNYNCNRQTLEITNQENTTLTNSAGGLIWT